MGGNARTMVDTVYWKHHLPSDQPDKIFKW